MSFVFNTFFKSMGQLDGHIGWTDQIKWSTKRTKPNWFDSGAKADFPQRLVQLVFSRYLNNSFRPSILVTLYLKLLGVSQDAWLYRWVSSLISTYSYWTVAWLVAVFDKKLGVLHGRLLIMGYIAAKPMPLLSIRMIYSMKQSFTEVELSHTIGSHLLPKS